MHPQNVDSGERFRDDESGASLVEFALILPVLLLFLMGLMEIGWAHTQNLDVRHGAREGARLAAVNYDEGTTTGVFQLVKIVQETCNRLDDGDFNTSVTLTFDVVGQTSVGDSATMQISRTYEPLTGLFPMLDGIDLDSTIEFRLERQATWDEGTVTCP